MCTTLQSFLLHRVSIILFRAVLGVVCALHWLLDCALFGVFQNFPQFLDE